MINEGSRQINPRLLGLCLQLVIPLIESWEWVIDFGILTNLEVGRTANGWLLLTVLGITRQMLKYSYTILRHLAFTIFAVFPLRHRCITQGTPTMTYSLLSPLSWTPAPLQGCSPPTHPLTSPSGAALPQKPHTARPQFLHTLAHISPAMDGNTMMLIKRCFRCF